MSVGPGCATYRVRVVNRRTGSTVWDLTELDATGTFEHLEREVSGCEVVVPLERTEGVFCPPVHEPKMWADELVVERFGPCGEPDGGVRFIGPIRRVIRDTLAGTLTIQAEDRSVWWGRRGPTRTDLSADLVDETTLFAQLAEDSQLGDQKAPPVLRPVLTGSLKRDVDLPAGSDFDLFDLEEFPNVRWAVVGPTLLGPGPSTVPQDRGRSFAVLDTGRAWVDEGFVEDDDGQFVTDQVTVAGVDADDNRVVGVFPPDDLVSFDRGRGLHRAPTVESETLTTVAELTEEARRIFLRDRFGNQFLVTSDGSLSKDAPPVDELLPGRLFDVRFGDVASQRRLQKLVVEFGPGSDCDGERCLVESRVAVDLQPAGSDRVSADRASI